jgi:uncharacterized protein
MAPIHQAIEALMRRRGGNVLASAWLLLLLIGAAACQDSGSEASGGDVAGGEVTDDSAEPADGVGEVEAQDEPCHEHVFEDVQVPLRDGKWLAGIVRRPVDESCRLPTILTQTPYDKDHMRGFLADGSAEPVGASRDYAFVVTDWRGMHGSAEAALEEVNPLEMPYGKDGYDTVEWIAEQPWSDGKVGTWGASALALVQYQTAVERPPHLVAAVPMCNPMNVHYETYYPGGALRRAFYDWALEEFGEAVSLVGEHPLEDGIWQLAGGLLDPTAIEVPMLMMAGWYDLYNPAMWRTWDEIVAAAEPTLRDRHRLLVGDWHHFFTTGGNSATRPLTEQELAYSDPDRLAQWASLAFFDLHLRGLDSEAADWAPVRFQRSASESDALESVASWPPEGPTDTSWYLGGEGNLSPSAPAGGLIEFSYDPTDPSPTVGGCTLDGERMSHGPQDQAAVIAREDARAFVSEPLDEALLLTGRPFAELSVRTTGQDTDFVLRLTDVDEDGSHLLIAQGVRRLKLREGFSAALPVEPGETYDVTVQLGHLAYRFAPGHRVGLILTSSNYPFYEANPNTGADFFTTPEASEPVTNTVVLGGTTRLVLPVDAP